MKILLLGGTGAMGTHLTSILAASEKNEVYVTSRSKKKSHNNISYIKGNAHEIDFLNHVLNYTSWDCIVDFMSYKTQEFQSRVSKLLKATKQYIFLSSSRVYANSDTPIIETSPRLLDITTDEQFLATDEYALAKAREENLLFQSKDKNWTIVRPYVTYSEQRLQLGVHEKESWLWLAMNTGFLVFSKDIAQHVTTLTYGHDVARGIAALIGKSDAFGEAFHITCNTQIKWGHVFNLYNKVFNDIGIDIKTVLTDKTIKLLSPARYQVIYDRYYDRVFDNSKINKYINTASFMSPEIGLAECLKAFLKHPMFKRLDINSILMIAKSSGIRIKISQISGIENQMKYILIKTHLIKVVRYGKLLFSRKTDSNPYRAA